MTYEATIASAGGDDPIMVKSFVMVCEGPIATWYSYLQPLSIFLKEKTVGEIPTVLKTF